MVSGISASGAECDTVVSSSDQVWNVVHTDELLQCGFEGRFNEVLWLGRAEDSSPPITDDVCVLVEVVARAGELRGESLVFLCVDR